MSGLKQQQVMISAVMLLVASIKLCFDVHVTPCAFFFSSSSSQKFSFISLVPLVKLMSFIEICFFRGLNLELNREMHFSVFYVIYKVSYTTNSADFRTFRR